jgi:hypothetical protein
VDRTLIVPHLDDGALSGLAWSDHLESDPALRKTDPNGAFLPGPIGEFGEWTVRLDDGESRTGDWATFIVENTDGLGSALHGNGALVSDRRRRASP